MKFKPTDKAGELLVELGPKEAQLPGERPEGMLPVFQLNTLLVPVDCA